MNYKYSYFRLNCDDFFFPYSTEVEEYSDETAETEEDKQMNDSTQQVVNSNDQNIDLNYG